jgi:hypothetical protein
MATMRRIRASLNFLFLLALVLSGCSGDSDRTTAPTSTDQDQVVNLNDPNGGFTATDEAPAFGEADLLDLARAEAPVADSVAGPSLSDGEYQAPAHIYAMTILWGMLPEPGDPASSGHPQDDGDTFDWSGSMVLSRGNLVITTTVSFEPEDSIIRPRPNRRSVQWISHTGSGFDGLRVMIYQPPLTNGAIDDTLTLTAGSYSRTFLLSELGSLSEDVPMGDTGTVIRFLASESDPFEGKHGSLLGLWAVQAPGDSVGRFSGIWVADGGRALGFYRGYYAEDPRKGRVLFAKMTDLNGVYRGVLRGNWDSGQVGPQPDDGNPNHGWFAARWFNGDKEIGMVRGHWRFHTGRGGNMDGRWCVECRLSTEDHG